MKSLVLVWSLILISLFVSCTRHEAVLGSKENPIKFFFIPSSDAENITSNATGFIEYLEKETGYYFSKAVPTSYIAVVEAFGANRADFSIMNSFGYLMVNKKYGGHAKMTVVRFGDKTYKGQIIAHVDSGINKLEDINGKRFAFTESASTSGYLFPLKVLKEKNIQPKNTVFAMKHDNVVAMIYQKQVDAGATYYTSPGPDGKIRDARMRVLTQFPDVEKKVKIIATTEDILNDPLVVRKDLPPELVDKVINAMTKYLSTPDGLKVFKNIYGVDGLVPATDADYDGLRKMLEVNQINPDELLKK